MGWVIMQYTKQRAIFIIYDFVVTLSLLVLTYILRYSIGEVFTWRLLDFLVLYIVGFAVVYIRYKVYVHLWKRTGFGQLVSIVKTTFFTSLFVTLVELAVRWKDGADAVHGSVLLFSWTLVTTGLCGVRFLSRLYGDEYQHSRRRAHGKRALLIGAGSAGMMVLNQIKSNPKGDIYPVAFIDDNPSIQGAYISGLKVIGGRDRIPRAVVELEIAEIIVAMPSVRRSEVAKILEICKETQIHTKIIPDVDDIVSGKLLFKMREVKIEDLLGRQPHHIDMDKIAGYLTSRTVLVTGAGGSIGSELCRQIARYQPKLLVLLGHGETSIHQTSRELQVTFPELNLVPVVGDVRNVPSLTYVFAQYRPDTVFHAAAHKHVPLMEQFPLEAIANNVLGTKNVACCAHEFEASKFVMISTDKAVNPTSIMGVTKRIAEMHVQSLNEISQTCFSVVRFGNVLGSRGSVVPIFKEQIERGGPVTVTHPDMVRYFMTIPEAVQLVIQAGAYATGGEIFVLDMGQPVKILDLARDLIALSGYVPDEDIKIVFSGMRPGEKLFEEILTNEEGMSSTSNDQIFIAPPINRSFEEITKHIKVFEMLSNAPNQKLRARDAFRSMWALVPNYKGENPMMSSCREEIVEASF